ncbi:MAG: Rha family transcriptional regulator [Firmicutes bacterium]|nr:Rha family transcriptional regulator [Bacillota bacterium]
MAETKSAPTVDAAGASAGQANIHESPTHKAILPQRAKNCKRENATNLVFLKPDRLDSEPFTTSEVIVERAGVQRHTVQQLLQKYEADFTSFGSLAFQMQVRPRPESTGATQLKVYHLNEPQATLLMTFLRNTPQVIAFKKELVRQFYAMRQELTARQVKRSALKPVRRELTDVLKDTGAGQWAYKNYMDMCYLAVLGKTAKTIREERGAPARANATEFLSSAEMEDVTQMTCRAAVFRETGFDYVQTKALLERCAVGGRRSE